VEPKRRPHYSLEQLPDGQNIDVCISPTLTKTHLNRILEALKAAVYCVAEEVKLTNALKNPMSA
jgi:hypothetical protein